MAIVFVNRHPTREADIPLNGVNAQGAKLVVLDGNVLDAFNDVSNP